MYRLSSDRLSINVLSPESGYSGQRFDRCGIIEQVRVDQETTFCANEFATDSGRGGIGLCNEFGIFDPIHVADSQVGDWFPKIGVGLLERAEGEYLFYGNYPCEKSSIAVEESEQALTFKTEHRAAHGVAVRYEKCISLIDNAIRVDFKLENIGQQAIVTTEYCHNFLSLAGRAPADGLSLRMNNKRDLELPDELSSLLGSGLQWQEQTRDKIFLQYPATNLAGFAWELSDSKTGCAMREYCSAANNGFTLFSTDTYVSPEAFVKVDVPVAGSMQWTRRYEFAVNGHWLNGDAVEALHGSERYQQVQRS